MMRTDAELKLKAKLLAIRSTLNQDDAEHLVSLAKGDDILIGECLELERSGVTFPHITEWLEAKTGLIQAGSQSYRVCEAVLNLAMVGDRTTQ
jgi:hypothetical protein